MQVPAGLAEEATCWASGRTDMTQSRGDSRPAGRMGHQSSGMEVLSSSRCPALGLTCSSHILKIGWEASTSLKYFGKFYSAFLQLLSILLSMVLRRIHGTYTNNTLPYFPQPWLETLQRTSPVLLHTSARSTGRDNTSVCPGSSAPMSP